VINASIQKLLLKNKQLLFFLTKGAFLYTINYMGRKKSRSKTKKGIFSFLRGSVTITLLLIIVIAGSIMLAGGIFPKLKEPLPDAEEAIPDMSSITPGGKDSLQLKTLKFKKCSGQTTVDLLLDRSSSMSLYTPSGQTKISRLKEAMLALTNKLSDSSIIGIQSFSSLSITDDVTISYYKDVKGIIPSKVNALIANGSTPTHDALTFSLGKLKEALPKFPAERKFNFILVSDGAPCPGVGCPQNPGADQDPRKYNPNPADEIKNLGVTVYTLGIYDSAQSRDPKLAELLRSIATKPENYFEAQTGDQTTKLLEAISTKICAQTN